MSALWNWKFPNLRLDLTLLSFQKALKTLLKNDVFSSPCVFSSFWYLFFILYLECEVFSEYFLSLVVGLVYFLAQLQFRRNCFEDTIQLEIPELCRAWRWVIFPLQIILISSCWLLSYRHPRKSCKKTADNTKWAGMKLTTLFQYIHFFILQHLYIVWIHRLWLACNLKLITPQNISPQPESNNHSHKTRW